MSVYLIFQLGVNSQRKGLHNLWATDFAGTKFSVIENIFTISDISFASPYKVLQISTKLTGNIHRFLNN